MKRSFFALAVLLIATPIFAQDEGGGGGAFAGGGGNQVFTRIDAVNPMEPVKAFLQSKANITLSADQEKTLRPQVEAAFQQIRDLSERAAAQRGGGAGGGDRRGGGGFNGGGAGGGGERRGGRGRGAGADPNSLAALQSGPAAEELKKINDDLMGKITAALKPDQQAAFKKYLNGEIKKAGGLGALKVTMEEAGAPFTPEQETQLQGFYNDDAQQRAQLRRESQGAPDPAKLADIDKATMTKVVKILTPAQRKALTDSRAKPQ
jgi:hypothetical protein